MGLDCVKIKMIFHKKNSFSELKWMIKKRLWLLLSRNHFFKKIEFRKEYSQLELKLLLLEENDK